MCGGESFFEPDNAQDIPGIIVQITRGVDTYIIWAGTTTQAISGGDEAQKSLAVQSGRLGVDWACSMPSPKPSMPVAGTTLLRTSQDPVALPLSQRLAQRFKKQMFVSIDISASQKIGGKGPMVALAVEKAVIVSLKALENP